MAVAHGMKFGVQADFIQFDVAKWSVDQKKAVVKAMKTAARKWLEIIVQRTPRSSGFLLSAFDNLAVALGVSISGNSLKKGQNAYGRGRILDALTDKYKNIRELAIVKGWLERKRTSRGYERAIGKPLSKAHLRERAEKYAQSAGFHRVNPSLKGKGTPRKRKPPKQKKTKGGTSASSNEHVGNLLNEGLNVRGSLDNAEKTSTALYKRQQALKFYAEQRNRKAAQRTLARLAKIRQDIKDAKKKYERAVEREPPLKQKRRGKRYKWEKVEITKDVTKQKLVEIPNPAYKPTAVLAARKNKTAPPPKTIQVLQTVTEKETKIVRRRIKAGSDKDWQKIYLKYYYPQNGVKGPIKNPHTGRDYGTDPDRIFFMETQNGGRQSVSEETEAINKGGFDVPGREIGGAGYTPTSALSNVSPVRESKMKITFEYKVDIRYWKLMDQIGRWTQHGGKPVKAKGAPWGAIIKANLAYRSILKQELEAAILPFTKYMVKTTSKFAPGFKGGSV